MMSTRNALICAILASFPEVCSQRVAASSIPFPRKVVKWNPQTKAEHEIYFVAKFDPCGDTQTNSNPSDEAGSSRGSRRQSPDEKCKSGLQSYDLLHPIDRTRCLHAAGAACRMVNKKNTCTVLVPKKCLNFFSFQDTVPFSHCAKNIVKRHGEFLETELKDMLAKTATQKKGKAIAGSEGASSSEAVPWVPCGCSHCLKCPLQPVGCPYCTVKPRSVGPEPLSPRTEKAFVGWMDQNLRRGRSLKMPPQQYLPTAAVGQRLQLQRGKGKAQS